MSGGLRKQHDQKPLETRPGVVSQRQAGIAEVAGSWESDERMTRPSWAEASWTWGTSVVAVPTSPTVPTVVLGRIVIGIWVLIGPASTDL